MRNLKKFLALALAMIMVVSASAVVSADFGDVAGSRYEDAINDLAVKGIVKGTSDTTFGPDQDVKRWQMALFVARAMTGIVESDADWANGHVRYVDVTEYKGAIEYVESKGVINGWADPINGDPVFGPNDGITYAQALKMAVCALGYNDGSLEWPWGYYNKAADLGLTTNMLVGDINDTLDRAETAQIIYNMIYAAPADNGLTFAETNFSIKTADNTTLFVVVATPKQYYSNSKAGDTYNSASDVGGTWVGIQPLVNGVPSGAIYYLPVEKLGVAAGEVEEIFNRTVALVNYDAATGEFTDVEIGAAPTIVSYKDITFPANAKLKYNNVTYTSASTLTGATLVNEIIVYDGANAITTAKVLPTNEDGNIINGKGEVVATVLYTSSNGTKWYFDTNNALAMDENDALDAYGVWVKDEAAQFVKYNTIDNVKGALNNKAYQLEMYDDDADGKYERAVVRYIYMGVYHTEIENIGNSEKEADGMLLDNGILKEAKSVTYVYADGVEKKAQQTGSINVYTYNAQRNIVTVLDILELKTGTLTKVNAKGYHSTTDTTNTIQLTFDGTTTLTLAYNIDASNANKTVNGAKLGADLKGNDEKAAKETVLDVTSEAFLEYYYTSKAAMSAFVDTYKLGETYAYYAYNGYIIMLDIVEDEIIYNFAVMEEFYDFDFGEIYVNMYVGDEYVEEATVTVLDGKVLADLSNYKFSMLISKQEYFYPGIIYEVEKVEDTYEIYDEVTVDNYLDYGFLNAKVADDNYDEDDVDAQEGILQFTNGSTRGDVRGNRLRTNSNTVFYFIEPETLTDEELAAGETPDPMNTTVTAFYGNAGNNSITFNADTQIWTDSLGTTNEQATVVYVINPVAQTFFESEMDTVWVLMNLSSEHTCETVLAADELGDAAADYDFDSRYLYKYTGKFWNIDTGAQVASILTEERLTKSGSSFRLVLVDENGVYAGKNIQWNAGTDGFKYVQGARDYAAYGIKDVNGVNASTANNANWGKPNGGVNYFDWMYCHKEKIDYEGFPKVPNSILEVKLVEDLFEAEFVGDNVVIWNLKDDTALTVEADDITDLIVIDLGGTQKTGEAAFELLLNCPQVVYYTGADYTADGSIVFIVANYVQDK